MFKRRIFSGFILLVMCLVYISQPVGVAYSAPAVSAETIDAYLSSKGSPMVGTGSKFIEFGRIHGVDPRLIVAIAGAESSFGKNNCASYNAWGWMYWDNNGVRKCFPFSSWEAGIDKVSWQIGSSSLYFKDGLKTIPDIGRRYCGSGCTDWFTNVPTFYAEMGGDANNLTFSENGTPANTRTQFASDLYSRLYMDQNYDRLNLEVCAANLPNNTVYVIVNRPGREWRYSMKADGRCVTFWDMDGAGPVIPNITYSSRAALNEWPDPNWPIPCAGATGGYGLCDNVAQQVDPIPEPPTPTPPTPTPPTPEPQPLAASVTASFSNNEVQVGETVMADIALNPPGGGAAGLELVCQVDPSLLSFDQASPTGLFGSDPVMLDSGKGSNGQRTLSIAGSGGNLASSPGSVFSFTLTALNAGQAKLDCTASVTDNSNNLTQAQFTPASINITVQDTPPPVAQITGTLTGTISRYGSQNLTDIQVLSYDSANQQTGSAGVDAGGSFRLELPQGRYSLRAGAPGCLLAEGMFDVTGGQSVTLSAVQLVPGDIDNSGSIDELDVVTLGGTYHVTPPTVPAADLTGDGVVDLRDLTLLAKFYRQTGPVAWTQ